MFIQFITAVANFPCATKGLIVVNSYPD